MASDYAPLTYSPYADVPLWSLSPADQAALYFSRTDESFSPYSVEQVLREVYRRDFRIDLNSWLSAHQRGYLDDDGRSWNVSGIRVVSCDLLSTESILEQLLESFFVDLRVRARVRVSLVERGLGRRTRAEVFVTEYRLRYCFDFTPSVLRCGLSCVIEDEASGLWNRYPDCIRLNEYLLPMMELEDFSRFADELRVEGLGIPPELDTPLSSIGMAAFMRVTVREEQPEDEDILGEYFFSHGSARVLDPDFGMLSRAPVEPDTVLISVFLDDPRQRNTVLTHELSHKFLDTPFFMLQKTHGHKYCSRMCARRGPAGKGRSEPLSLMERQADRLTSCLMIPTLHGSRHAAALRHSYGTGRSEEGLTRLVRDMAAFYCTTKAVAYRRLLDFGYTELREIVRRFRTHYQVPEQEALAEFRRNPAFRAQLGTGRYLCADGAFCLNSEKYLCFDPDGTPHLTPWALSHLSECCLPFRLVSDPGGAEPNGSVLKSSGQGRRRVVYVGPNGESPVTPEGRALLAELRRQRAERELFTPSFNELTVALMRRRHMTEAALVEASGLSRGTVSNLRNDPVMDFPVQTLVAFCIALHLEPQISMKYLEASTSKFGSTDAMCLYEYALLNWYRKPVPEVNRLLVEAGVEPLTNLVDGYSEDGRRVS